MTLRNWLGGGNNLATNANDWSPAGTPAPGDQLTIGGGTIHIVGAAINNTTLIRDNGGTSSNATLDLSGGNVPLQLVDQGTNFGATTINIAALSMWVGTLATSPDGKATTIQGKGTWDNNGPSFLDGHTIVRDQVIGTGTITIPAAHATTNIVEFDKGVGFNQRVTLGGYQGDHAKEIIAAPDAYHATTTLGFAEISLQGLTASSYELAGGALTLFNAGGAAVYSMALTVGAAPPATAPLDFGVSQTATGIIVHADGASGDFSGGITLPVHT